MHQRVLLFACLVMHWTLFTSVSEVIGPISYPNVLELKNFKNTSISLFNPGPVRFAF